MAGSLIPVLQVKEILARMDIELVEFTGGTFSHAPMLECYALLVLPPSKKIINFDGFDYFEVGKGQYEQIKTFGEKNSGDIYMITGVDTNESGDMSLLVDEVYASHLTDKDWQLHYGKIELWENQDFLDEFDDVFALLPKTDLLLDYNWNGAMDSLKPKLPESISIKKVVNNSPSAFGTYVHEMMEKHLNELGGVSTSIPIVKPLLICVKLAK